MSRPLNKSRAAWRAGPERRAFRASGGLKHANRLIEIALHLGDTANVDDYVNRLGSIGKSADPSVAYVEGKHLFFRQRYEQAVTRLQVVPKGHKNWYQAQYIIGASLVALGRRTTRARERRPAFLSGARHPDCRRRIAGSGGRARQSFHPGLRRPCDDVHPGPVSHIPDGLKTRLTICRSDQAKFGNQRPISRAADSGESEPCTRLN